jgi:hypothetical protein
MDEFFLAGSRFARAGNGLFLAGNGFAHVGNEFFLVGSRFARVGNRFFLVGNGLFLVGSRFARVYRLNYLFLFLLRLFMATLSYVCNRYSFSFMQNLINSQYVFQPNLLLHRNLRVMVKEYPLFDKVSDSVSKNGKVSPRLAKETTIEGSS